jgi:hypothetical protein
VKLRTWVVVAVALGGLLAGLGTSGLALARAAQRTVESSSDPRPSVSGERVSS